MVRCSGSNLSSVSKLKLSLAIAPGTESLNLAGSVVGTDKDGVYADVSVVSGPGPTETGIIMFCL